MGQRGAEKTSFGSCFRFVSDKNVKQKQNIKFVFVRINITFVIQIYIYKKN